MNDIAVSVRGLSKAYTISHDQEKHITLAETMLARLKNPLRRPKTETFWALKDIDFDIKRGDVVGIIGRNGAGKSTLLKILSRITEPTTGQIDLYGRVGSLLEVGTGFHPELTGRENVFLNGAILGMSKNEIKKQFDAIVDFAGVEKFLDTPVKRYSSGMYVRLAFAVAAHLNPEILIVDEVLAVGDTEFQKKCLGKMKEVGAEGRTVLFVSHNMAAIEALATSCMLLEKGNIAEYGLTRKVIDCYLHHSEQRASHDLSDWRERQGVGPQRLISVAAMTSDGRVAQSFRPGDPVILNFTVESPALNSWDLAFAIEDELSYPLFASHLSDKCECVERKGRVQFQVVLDPNYLRQGRYQISTGIYSSDVRTRHDELLHYPIFELLGHSTKVPDDNRWGAMYIPFEWTELPVISGGRQEESFPNRLVVLPALHPTVLDRKTNAL